MTTATAIMTVVMVVIIAQVVATAAIAIEAAATARAAVATVYLGAAIKARSFLSSTRVLELVAHLMCRALELVVHRQISERPHRLHAHLGLGAD